MEVFDDNAEHRSSTPSTSCTKGSICHDAYERASRTRTIRANYIFDFEGLFYIQMQIEPGSEAP